MNSVNSVKLKLSKGAPNGNLLGTHAENREYFKSDIITILEYTRDARLICFPEDGASLSKTFSFYPLRDCLMCALGGHRRIDKP